MTVAYRQGSVGRLTRLTVSVGAWDRSRPIREAIHSSKIVSSAPVSSRLSRTTKFWGPVIRTGMIGR
jgi:hypothetical protein